MSRSESIYNWIEREPEVQRRAPRHRSKHDPTLPPTGTTFVAPNTTKPVGANLGQDSTEAIMRRGSRRPGATFGKPRESLKPNPANFTRAGAKVKHSDTLRAAPVKGVARRERVKPALPKQTERPVMGIRSNKNFVVANAVENILAVPKRGGGARPDYTRKADYGKVPAYLDDVKREIDEERELIEEMYMEAGPETEAARGEDLEVEEREALLAALKAKWEDVNRRYQRVTHMTKLDTIGKVRRKEAFEQELAQLEKDIAVLGQRRPIVVVDDQ